jgi:hypothetical protein
MRPLFLFPKSETGQAVDEYVHFVLWNKVHPDFMVGLNDGGMR